MPNANSKFVMMQPHACCCHSDLLIRVEGVLEKMEPCHHGGPPCCYRYEFCIEHYWYRLDLYLHGTGAGENTHASICITTRQGPYDNALTWPPNFRMRLSLVNQYSGGHLEYTLTPDAEGNFIQPRWETFIPVTELRQPYSSYVKDDVLFIKVTKLKNPVPTTFDSISEVTCLNM